MTRSNADRNVKSATLTAVEDRVGHAVAGGDAELLGGAGHHLEHGQHRAAGGNQRFRKRHGVLGDPQDAPVGADEDHIERNVGVLHPEAGRLLAVEVEQHALPFRQLLAEHQAFRLLLRSHSHFDCEDMYAALAGDFERLQFGCREQAGTAERQGEERDNGENGEQDTTHGQASMLEGPNIAESPPMLSRTPARRSRGRDGVRSQFRVLVCWLAVGQCEACPCGTPSGRTSAAINPFGPGPKRTSTYCPGRNSVSPKRRSVSMCTKISSVPSPRVRKPNPRSRLNHFTCARSSPLVAVTVRWVRGGGICAGCTAVDSSMETTRKACRPRARCSTSTTTRAPS